MDVNDIIDRVESSKDYKDFIKNNPDHYLVHLFAIIDSSHINVWQVGYYGKETDKITVIDLTEDGTVKVLPAQEAFKEQNYIAPLDIKKIKVSKDDAITIIEKVLKDNYSAESMNKIIMLLQNLPEFGQIWNATIVTATFSVINIKIDAATSKMLKHSKESLLGWKKE